MLVASATSQDHTGVSVTIPVECACRILMIAGTRMPPQVEMLYARADRRFSPARVQLVYLTRFT